MTVKLIVDNIEVPVKKISFSDGSSNFKLEIPQTLKDRPPSSYFSISVCPTTPADMYAWEIALLFSAVDNTWGVDEFNRALLDLPYLPHARADRVFEEGNPHPLNVFLLGLWWPDQVFLTDPHSGHYKKVLKSDTVVKTQDQCFVQVIRDIQKGSLLVAPDKGAVDKVITLHQHLYIRGIETAVIQASKHRDVSTGKIMGTTLPDGYDYTGKHCYIVDDIADGGGTFIPLAHSLREAGAYKVTLYVTHGIFAKGLDIFKGVVDNIHCYQVVGNHITMNDIHKFNAGV
jgi:ribose-phosphate pyrophosphokinase